MNTAYFFYPINSLLIFFFSYTCTLINLIVTKLKVGIWRKVLHAYSCVFMTVTDTAIDGKICSHNLFTS